MAAVAHQKPFEHHMQASSSDEEGGGCCQTADEGYAMPAGEPAYVRREFVRKVYTLLSIQLIITVIIACPLAVQSKAWIHQHMWLYIACSATAVFLTLVAMCNRVCGACGCACLPCDILKTTPWNMMFLFTVTACLSVTVGFACSMYTLQSVALALVVTAGIFICLSLYACFTTTDFTGCWPFMMCMLFFSLIFPITLFIFYASGVFVPVQTVRYVYAGFGILMFSFYIVFDTQMILAKNKYNKYDIDDAVLATLELYLDILNMFLYVLQLLGDRK